MYAGGSFSADENNLLIDTYGIVRCLFNGASSTLQVNNNTQITGDFGANDLGGFVLGADGNLASRFTHMEVKEVIVRNVADSAQDEGTIYNYLSSKYGI